MSGAGPRGPMFIGNTGLTAGAGALPPAAHAPSHQDAGSDEINVGALSGELADDQPPKVHALGGAKHSADTLANLNLKVSDATLDDSGDPRTPTVHASGHENAGGDEISVAGLSGLLADDQNPTAHAAAHEDGGADEIEIASLPTSESDADKRLGPTGAGGVQWNKHIDVIPFYNGAILEDHTLTVTSDGAIVTLSLEKSGGGDLNLFFDGALTLFSSSPAATIALSAGSDTSPQINYVYIPKSTGVLTVSTVAFDNTEQIAHIATVLVQSATGVQADGCYKCHAWTDHLTDSLDRGHLEHVNEWIRKRPAGWESGVDLTPTVGVLTFDIATAAGQVFQLHRHAFPAFDTSVASDIYIVNDSVTTFKKVGNLVGELTDSLGASMSNRDFSLVIWGVQSEDSADCKLYCNLPSGSYAIASQALEDPSKFTDFTIPPDFVGSGFLIARLVMSHSPASGGTWTLTQNEDLRGQVPQTGAGGATAQNTTFPDNVFRVFDEGDNTKQVALQLSGLATATTRILTVQDQDGTIALVGQAPAAHALGGAEHNASTLAALINKISDASVLYSNKSGEISSTTLKATPVAADTVLIEDSAASNAKKRAPFSAFGGGGAPNVGFYATRASGNQTLNSASETQIQYPNDQDDPGDDFNTTSDEFVAPTTGRYTFSASAEITLAAAGRVEIRLYHGSTLVASGGSRTNQAETLRCCVSVVRQMAATNVMEVRAFQTSGFASTIQNSNLHFSGAQIRAD